MFCGLMSHERSADGIHVGRDGLNEHRLPG